MNLIDVHQDIRPMLMGAQDGIVTTGSVVIALLSTGHPAWMVRAAAIISAAAGASSMALAEWTSVSGQRDAVGGTWYQNPMRAGIVSWISFMIGSLCPILAVSMQIPDESRVVVAMALTAAALAMIGAFTAWLGSGDMSTNVERTMLAGSVAVVVSVLSGKFAA